MSPPYVDCRLPNADRESFGGDRDATACSREIREVVEEYDMLAATRVSSFVEARACSLNAFYRALSVHLSVGQGIHGAAAAVKGTS